MGIDLVDTALLGEGTDLGNDPAGIHAEDKVVVVW